MEGNQKVFELGKDPVPLDARQPETRQRITQIPKQGDVIGTNKAGLKFGDLKPYSKCKIKHRGTWVHDPPFDNSGNWGWSQVYYYPGGIPTKWVEDSIDDTVGPTNTRIWDQWLQLWHRKEPMTRELVERALIDGVELPPWRRSPPLGFIDLIAKHCK